MAQSLLACPTTGLFCDDKKKGTESVQRGSRSGRPAQGARVADRYGLKAFDAASRVGEASSLADEAFHCR